MIDHITFSALLCSRLCHDLVNPVGAFSNGLEILAEEEDPDMRRQVIELLNHSAQQTAQRLQFFRLAFGSGGGFGEAVAATVVREAAAAYLAGGKTVLHWGDNVAELPKEGVKILLNMVLIGSEMLLRGGRLAIESGRNGGALEMRVNAAGDKVLVKEGLEAALSGDSPLDALDPKTAPAYLAGTAARAVGGELHLARAADHSLHLTARLP